MFQPWLKIILTKSIQISSKERIEIHNERDLFKLFSYRNIPPSFFKITLSPQQLPEPHMVIIEYQQLIWIGVCEVYAFSVHTYLTGFAEVV